KPGTNYANVLRQLQIMHGKGLLSRDETGRPQVYAPAQTREAIQSQLLKDVIHKLFAGSGKALVLAALHGHVTREERAEIGQVLLAKDADAVVPIASLTKLMTAMVLLDAKPDMNEPIRIDAADVDLHKHSSSRVPVGVTLPRSEVLHLALMSSDNRAAAALA